jgi:protein-disulfide isomerase
MQIAEPEESLVPRRDRCRFEAAPMRRILRTSLNRLRRWMPGVSALAGLLLVAGAGAAPLDSPGNVVAAEADSATSARPMVRVDHDYRLGDSRANIGIVEFSDYQCPYCREFHQELFAQIKHKFVDTGVVQFIHMDLPLTMIHDQAMPAALAGVCAGAQGRFWAMHDALFERTLEPGTYADLAQALGLDSAKFAVCLKSRDSERAVSRDVSDAVRLGIGGTPSFLIGRIDGNVLTVVEIDKGAPTLEEFTRQIEALR